MYTYVLKSLKREWHYVGLSSNLENRLKAHDLGWVSKTKFYRPFKLIHVELTESLVSARTMEKFFKSGYGREVILEIETYLPS